MVEVHLVFDQLDDGHEQVGIAQPAEYIFESAEVFVGDALGNAVAERGQDDHRNAWPCRFDGACHVEALIVARTRHADDEIVGHVFQLRQCLVAGTDLREARRVAQRQRGVFVEYLFVDAAVVFEHEGIVGVGYQKYVEDTAGHQVGELRILQIKQIEFQFAEHVFPKLVGQKSGFFLGYAKKRKGISEG